MKTICCRNTALALGLMLDRVYRSMNRACIRHVVQIEVVHVSVPPDQDWAADPPIRDAPSGGNLKDAFATVLYYNLTRSRAFHVIL